ncbi:MAG: DUF1573 domain-containing protein [Bacteroidota bacterium]
MSLNMRFSLVPAFLILTHVIFAQAKLSFDEESHSFGDIEEEAGYAEHTFSFVNTGDQPIKISNVKASCGCTTPGWSKEQVMPGDSGFIKARYNPRNRPGRFRKSLRITTTQPSENKVLYISGFVKPKPKSIEEEFTISAGRLRLKYRSMNMGKMTTEKPVQRKFQVYNAGSDSLELLQDMMQVPTHIELALEPEKLAPKQKGNLLVNYDPSAKNDLGFISDNITLETDTAGGSKNEFYILSTIEEYFPEMTEEELEKAPKLVIEERVFDFGRVKAGEVVGAEFTLTNDGKDKLNFRKIKSNCSCVSYEIGSKNIKKGKSVSLKVLFDTTDRKANQYKTVTLFSNDPTAPTQVVTIKGVVDRVEQ